jgi:cytochrome c-type biogenesis protein CcmH/NrfG
VPGVACAALLCAGWVAGRGPLTESAAPGVRWRSPTLREVGPLRGAIAAAVIVCALLAAWAQWQPQRSVDAADEALALVGTNPTAALAAAHTAVSRDPLSAEALLTLAAVQQGAGQGAAAAATYERAVHLQPANFRTWQALGEYDLHSGNPQAALQAFHAAVYLNPQAVAPQTQIAGNAELLTIQDDYLQALRDTATGGGTAAR